MNSSKNERGYGLEFLVGCVFAFAVFALSFNSSDDNFLSYVRALWLILPLSTFTFAAPEQANKSMVFVAVNAPVALLWYVLVPDEWRFLWPLIVTLILSVGAVAIANVVPRIRRRKAL